MLPTAIAIFVLRVVRTFAELRTRLKELRVRVDLLEARAGDPRPTYERFRARGRLAPEELHYVSSWVTEDLTRCFQVMECADRALLDERIAAWDDLVEFEAIPVITSPMQPRESWSRVRNARSAGAT